MYTRHSTCAGGQRLTCISAWPGLALLLAIVLDLPLAAVAVAAGALGAFKGATFSPFESLFADSVPTGSRCTRAHVYVSHAVTPAQLPCCPATLLP